jgi:hypothetical protein
MLRNELQARSRSIVTVRQQAERSLRTMHPPERREQQQRLLLIVRLAERDHCARTRRHVVEIDAPRPRQAGYFLFGVKSAGRDARKSLAGSQVDEITVPIGDRRAAERERAAVRRPLEVESRAKGDRRATIEREGLRKRALPCPPAEPRRPAIGGQEK